VKSRDQFIVAFAVAASAVASFAQSPIDDVAALAKAKEVIANLQKNDTAAVEATFNDEMKKAMAGNSLKSFWTEVNKQAGALKQCPSFSAETRGAIRVVIHKCDFEKLTANISTAFDEKGMLAGFFTVPTAK
jgi:hypothetical protein